MTKFLLKIEDIFSHASGVIRLLHGMMTTKGLVPFCKTYIKAKVTTAAVGTNTYMMMFGTIYCKKL